METSKISVAFKVIDKATIPLLRMQLTIYKALGWKRFFKGGYWKIRYKLLKCGVL